MYIHACMSFAKQDREPLRNPFPIPPSTSIHQRDCSIHKGKSNNRRPGTITILIENFPCEVDLGRGLNPEQSMDFAAVQTNQENIKMNTKSRVPSGPS